MRWSISSKPERDKERRREGLTLRQRSSYVLERGSTDNPAEISSTRAEISGTERSTRAAAVKMGRKFYGFPSV
jgi:hypothetical protein